MRAHTTATVSEAAGGADLAFGPAPEPGVAPAIPFHYDRSSRLLWKDGVEVPVPPRVLGVLELLLARAGQLVSKQELISAVWRDAFVTETSLAEAVSFLRMTLGDDPQRPLYIQTLHRRGYRFIGEVRDVVPAAAIRTAPAPGAVHLEPEPRLSLLVPWVIALFALLTAAVAIWKLTHTEAPPDRLPARFAVSLPAGAELSSTGSPVAVSRDGALIAFTACQSGAGGDCSIYLRPIAEDEATLVAGTEGSSSPFFSPDGRWLGFFAHGTLQKIALAGGSPIVLAKVLPDQPLNQIEPRGASWMRDDRIVFAGAAHGGLSIVTAGGDAVSALTEPAGGERHSWPDVLPDGSAVVFTVTTTTARPDQTHAAVVSLRTRSWGRLLDGVSAVRAPVPGYLLAQRGSDLTAAPFDHRTLSLLALPTAVAPAALPRGLAPAFAMSEHGTLVLAPAEGPAALQVVLDWTGELRRLVPTPQPALPR